MNRLRFQLMAAVLGTLVCASALSAQTVSIVAGNGQAVCIGCQSSLTGLFQSLIVKVTDASGNPMAGQTVNWATNGPSLAAATSTTATDGTASNTLIPTLNGNSDSIHSFAQYTVTAQIASSTATFYETQLFADVHNPNAPPVVIQNNGSVPIGETWTGQVGTIYGTPIQIRVADEFGNAIPNVNVFLWNLQTPDVGPTVQCVSTPGAGPNVVLTDASGVATCNALFGGLPGTGQFRVVVAGAYPNGDTTQNPNGYYYLASNIKVTAGAPGSIKISQGDQQSTNPGQGLPSALVVEVDSPAGLPLGGVPVKWTASPASAVNISSPTGTTDGSGRVSTSVSLTPSAPLGKVQVTATLVNDSTKSVTFTVNSVAVVSINGFQVASGNNQTAAINTPFALPLVVQVSTSSGSAAGIPVQFAVASGSASLSSTSATTDSNGRAQVTATAGSVTGAVLVSAQLATATGVGTQTFSLTVVPPVPTITAGNFVNGADLQPNSISPCGLGAIAANAGSLGLPMVTPTFPGLPVSSGTVKVTFNNVNAPVLNISTNIFNQQQITFQVPCETTPGSSVPVALNVGGGIETVNVAVQPVSPGVFQTQMTDGAFRAVVVRPDGSYVSLENPARRGETLVAYTTGLGPTSPAVATGALPVPGGTGSAVLGTVVVGMNGGGVPLISAKLSEDLAGIYIVTFQIPNEMPTGNITFSIGMVPQGSSTAYYSALSHIPVQ